MIGRRCCDPPRWEDSPTIWGALLVGGSVIFGAITAVLFRWFS